MKTCLKIKISSKEQWPLFQRTWIQFPASIPWLTAIYNSRPKESNTIFRPLQALGTHKVHRQTYGGHTHTHTIKKLKSRPGPPWVLSCPVSRNSLTPTFQPSELLRANSLRLELLLPVPLWCEKWRGRGESEGGIESSRDSKGPMVSPLVTLWG